MSKEIGLQIYLFLVCFVTLLVAIIFLGRGAWGVLKITYPKITLSSHHWEKVYSSPESEETELILAKEKQSGQNEIVWSLIWLVIIIPILTAHWIFWRRWFNRKI